MDAPKSIWVGRSFTAWAGVVSAVCTVLLSRAIDGTITLPGWAQVSIEVVSLLAGGGVAVARTRQQRPARLMPGRKAATTETTYDDRDKGC